MHLPKAFIKKYQLCMQMGLFSPDKNRLCFPTFEHSCGGMLYGLDSGQNLHFWHSQ
jgi:hypothetical protein